MTYVKVSTKRSPVSLLAHALYHNQETTLIKDTDLNIVYGLGGVDGCLPMITSTKRIVDDAEGWRVNEGGGVIDLFATGSILHFLLLSCSEG